MKLLILLLAIAMLGLACGETSGPREMAPIASATGSWARIKLDSDIGFSEVAGMWTGDEALFVSGPTVLAYRPADGTTRVLVDVPQADDCEGCGYGQAAAWTGRELVMWGGGFTYARGGAAGVAFDPRSGELRPVLDAPIPVRWNPSAVWTGEEVIVWGGEGRVDGAAYDPVTNSWRRIANAPIEDTRIRWCGPVRR